MSQSQRPIQPEDASRFRKAFLQSRRSFLAVSGGATLSAAGVAAMAGLAGRAVAAAPSGANDVDILNAAVGAEHEAVAAYQLGADSGLLSKPARKTALTFQGHHRQHIDALANAIRKLGGEPVAAKAHYDFDTKSLKQERDVLTFAAGLERGAVSAYAGAIPKFTDRNLSLAAASILADEAMHWAVLRNALGLDPVPGAFFS